MLLVLNLVVNSSFLVFFVLEELASAGEKEWYFYCPRDRKYRNSARPNRVTAAGFWKATGTDRPIYSSDGTKCIGLKKSLVFYRGRAAKGMKTDWMMHEFRLPSLTYSAPQKKLLDKTIPPNVITVVLVVFFFSQLAIFILDSYLSDIKGFSFLNRMHGQYVGYSRKQTPWHRELCLILGFPHFRKLQLLIY